MKQFFSALILILAASVSAQDVAESQSTINNYKFVIVPSKFSFLKTADQYQLNTFTKMFLQKYGFVVYFDTDLLPPEAAGDNCNKLFADVVADTNMFITKLNVTLRDCMNNEVFRTETGSSREKEYKTSYREALRAAFKSFDTLAYSHNGKDGIRGQTGVSSTQVSMLKTAPASPQKEEVVVDMNTLFAQPVENGFQLVNSEPKVVFKLRKTSSDHVFLAEKGDKTGTLISKGKGKWVFEHYVDGKLVTEEVTVKF